MKVLLDTHIAIWAIADAPALPPAAKRVILDSGNEIYVSDISIWEIAIKSAAKPNTLPFNSAEFAEACIASGYRFLPVVRDALVAYENLNYEAISNAHKDPFDRLLLAQSKQSGMLFLTHDGVLQLYNEPQVLIV